MDREWEHVAVLGAAGKMGSGIALLLLQEMASMKGCVLTLLDTNSRGFEGLKHYLREHLRRYAEKNINRLRTYYQNRSDLIDNGEMIEAFVEEGLDRVRLVTSLKECQGARLIFEAILEDVEVKTTVLRQVNEVADPQAIFFTNTSSIPIHLLEERSHLEGRLIGFHFYNPPAVQKLLEIIVPKGVKESVVAIALEIGKRLNKTIVFSEDVAGFIGNGHFIREVVEACNQVERLDQKMSLPEAICMVNTITQNGLVRPMGMFQLIDYVGIDVVQHIAKVMTAYLPGQSFTHPIIDAMVSSGIKGGQNGDGSQKDGFFSYDKGKPSLVYDLQKHEYVPYKPIQDFSEVSWKTMSKERNKNELLGSYFADLKTKVDPSSKLAVHFLENSKKIAHALVDDKVAKSVNDVDTILQNGFFHLYGVEDPWKQQVGSK